LRPEGALPARSEIDPRRIEGALPYAFVLERLAPGLARLRVAGGHLSDLMGMEARGMPLSALFRQPDRTRLMGLMDKMFTAPRALELSLSARGAGSRKSIQAEMMVLPLLDDQGMVTRALGCVVARGAFPNPPYRFHIDGARETDLKIDPALVRVAPARAPKPAVPLTESWSGLDVPNSPGLAEPASSSNALSPPESRLTRPSGKAPFLRVVK
jgi:hypothetical protein